MQTEVDYEMPETFSHKRHSKYSNSPAKQKVLDLVEENRTLALGVFDDRRILMNMNYVQITYGYDKRQLSDMETLKNTLIHLQRANDACLLEEEKRFLIYRPECRCSIRKRTT